MKPAAQSWSPFVTHVSRYVSWGHARTHVARCAPSLDSRLNAAGEAREEKLTGKRSGRRFTKIFHGQQVTHDRHRVNHERIRHNELFKYFNPYMARYEIHLT